MTLVVCICSLSTMTIANGSGRRRMSRLMSESAATTARGGKPAHGVEVGGGDSSHGETRACVDVPVVEAGEAVHVTMSEEGD